MMNDVNAILWMETKNLSRDKEFPVWIRYLLFPIILTTLLSIVNKDPRSTSFLVHILAMLVAIFSSIILTPIVFLREKDGNIYRTLFTSRMEKKAIFWGKFLFVNILSIGISILFTLICRMMLALFIDHEIMQQVFNTAQWILVLTGWICAALTIGAGIILSLRVESSQQAIQKLITYFLIPPALVAVMLYVFHPKLSSLNFPLNNVQIILIIACVLLSIAAIVLRVAYRRFLAQTFE